MRKHKSEGHPETFPKYPTAGDKGRSILVQAFHTANRLDKCDTSSSVSFRKRHKQLAVLRKNGIYLVHIEVRVFEYSWGDIRFHGMLPIADFSSANSGLHLHPRQLFEHFDQCLCVFALLARNDGRVVFAIPALRLAQDKLQLESRGGERAGVVEKEKKEELEEGCAEFRVRSHSVILSDSELID